MKKIVMIIVLCLVALSLIFIVNTIESRKQTPDERRQEQQRRQEQEKGKKSVEKEETDDRKVIQSESRSLEFEFLSYEMIEDTEIEKQDTYKAEYFYGGEVPKADYQEEIIDYEKARKECPELREIWDGEDGVLTEDQVETYHKYIGKYKSMQHPKTRYLFVKCRITNLRDKSVDENVSLSHGIVSKDGTEYVYSDAGVYFDKPQHTEGEDRVHSFFYYNFAPKESLECTIGVEIKQKYGENEQYYIGFQPPDWNNDTGWPDTEPRMIKVTEIGG